MREIFSENLKAIKISAEVITEIEKIATADNITVEESKTGVPTVKKKRTIPRKQI